MNYKKDKIIIIGSSDQFSDVQPENVYPNFDGHIIKLILEEQNAIIHDVPLFQRHSLRRIIVINQQLNSENLQNEYLQELIINGRHYKLGLIIIFHPNFYFNFHRVLD